MKGFQQGQASPSSALREDPRVPRHSTARSRDPVPLSMALTRCAWTPRLMPRGANWEEQIWEGFVFFWATIEGFGACWPMGPPVVHAGLRGAGSSQASPLPPALPGFWAATEHPLGMKETTGPSQYRLPHPHHRPQPGARTTLETHGDPNGKHPNHRGRQPGGGSSWLSDPRRPFRPFLIPSPLSPLKQGRVTCLFFGRNPRREAPPPPR